LRNPGQISGVGARHALFPVRTTLGASLSRAVCFPTLLIAASDALGLIAGPSRSFQHRNFSSEASAPGSASSADESLAGRVLARLQRGISHQHLLMGTAPAFGRALAPCNGSDLLPLRLLSICSWVTRIYAPPQLGGFASFARLARSPPHRVHFRAPPCGPGLLVGWTHPNTALRPGYTVATTTLWVTASVAEPETGSGPDSTRRGF